MKNLDNIEEYLNNLSFEELKNIKKIITKEMRVKNPEYKNNLINNLINEINSKFSNSYGGFSLQNILWYLLNQSEDKDNLIKIDKEEISNNINLLFEKNIKKYLKNIQITNDKNPSSISNFEIKFSNNILIIIQKAIQHYGFKYANEQSFNFRIINTILNQNLTYSHEKKQIIENKFLQGLSSERVIKGKIELKEKYPEIFNKTLYDILNENFEIKIIDKLNNIENKFSFSLRFHLQEVGINEYYKPLKSNIENIKYIKSNLNNNQNNDMNFGF